MASPGRTPPTAIGPEAKRLGSSRLRDLARRSSGARAPAGAAADRDERCELCGAAIPAEHRHVRDLERGELLCVCRACSLLLDRRAAGGGHFRLVGDRRLRLLDFELTDLAWERLRIPVEIAFFFFSTKDERVMAFYPSPMGATESLLGLEAWRELEHANPILAELEPDVEALLVNRAKGSRRHWIVPIDDCYALVAVIRTRWKGLSGGQEVWEAIGSFFDALDGRSRPVGAEHPGRQEQIAEAATTSAAERS